MIMMRPRRPFVNIAQNIAVGTARLALRVSSPMCMILSKAVIAGIISYWSRSTLPSNVVMEKSQLTAEQKDVGQGTKVGRHEIIIPARRNIALEKDSSAVSGRHHPENNEEDEQEANVQDAGQQLEPRDNTKREEVDPGAECHCGENDQCRVPASRLIIRMC